MDRYGRQAMLAEVGAAGQARIARAIVDVPLDGLAADVAVRYLAGAGVGSIRVRDAALVETARALAPSVRITVDPSLANRRDAPSQVLDFGDPVAADVARGALAALFTLRAVLEDES